MNPSHCSHGHEFGPTRWTLVLRSQGATPEARAALNELCAAYYQPVVRFLQREGHEEDVARELAHEFFARLLQGGQMNSADPAKGRFRSYLLGALKHFLTDRRRKEARIKRGGAADIQSLDASSDSLATLHDMAAEAVSLPVLDTWFDRQWALTVMARALTALERQMTAEGRADHYAVLKPWLAGEAATLDAKAAAERLQLSESAFKVAVHRLRKRFRHAVKTEIAQTLSEGADLQEELRYLIEVLAASQR
ncbi:ECF-type sigma factor [Fontisphaera persica]|uniref:ECF-type sigma factor n=1 Tax=Fontisphaera persica TaxID=2974023 RepID=UPI0024C00952|nr:ECF-type sigma factor [Fontisphaera persica]WCJ60582.1 ECF-type sigma factor [Fontisphaera persica]